MATTKAKPMKNFFFLILFAISFLNTHGQIDKKSSTKKYQAGLIAGANASHFSSRVGEFSVLTNTSYSDYVRIAPMVGFHNRFNFSKAFSLSAELIFKSRGGSYRTDQTGVTTIGGNGDKAYYYRNYRLNYLEIPVVAELDLMPDVDDDRLHVRLGGGFSYGFYWLQASVIMDLFPLVAQLAHLPMLTRSIIQLISIMGRALCLTMYLTLLSILLTGKNCHFI